MSQNDLPDEPMRLPVLPDAHTPSWEQEPRPALADRDAVAVAGTGEKPAEPVDVEALRPRIIEALKTVYDPEIPVDVYELGLIYQVDIDADGMVLIHMTLTAPACPVAGILPQEVADKAASVAGVSQARVELVWDPPWSMERMSEAAKLELGFF